MKKHWRLFVVYAVMTAAALSLGWALQPPHASFPLFWPLSGLLLSALLLTPRRWWPAGLGLTFGLHVALRLLWVGADSLALTLLLAALQITQCYLAAYMTLALLNKPRRRAQVAELLAFGYVGVLVSSGLVWTFAAFVVETWFASQPYHILLTTVWFGDLLSVAAVGPVFCAMALVGRQAPLPARGELVENLLVGLLLVATAAYGFGPASASLAERLALPEIASAFLVVPLMLWSALRCDPRITAVGTLSALLIAADYAGIGLGPFVAAGKDWSTTHIQLQVYFFIACTAATGLAWVNYQRRHFALLQSARDGVGEVVVALFRRFGDGDRDGDAVALATAVDGALATLGSFAAADRAALLRFDDATGCLHVVGSWRADGIVPSPGVVDGMPLRALPPAMRRLQPGEEVFRVADHRSRARGGAADPLSGSGALSTGIVSVVDDGRQVGVLSVEWVRETRYWSDDVIVLLHLIGQLYVGACRRARTAEVVARYQQRLRSLATELALAEERTRRATAVDLHDGVAQNLAVASIKLAQLESDLGAANPDLAMLRDLNNDALRQARGLFRELSPSALYELGLLPALQSLIERVRREAGVRIRLRGLGSRHEIPESTRLVAYRVVSELLDNVVRHAHAGVCDVRIDAQDHALTVTVADDGAGFDSSLDDDGLPAGGRGLFRVRERVLSQGGRFEINSTPGSGTVVCFTIFHARSAAEEERHEYDTADS